MKFNFIKLAVILLTITIYVLKGLSQNAPAKVVAGIPVSYDEALVGTYTLPDALVLNNGKAVRKQVTVYFTKDTSDHKMDILIYLPANS